MLQALSVPSLRSIVLGALVLALGVAYVATDRTTTHRLRLHAIDDPNAFYLSAWRDGDVLLELEGDELRPLQFYVRASVFDGCRWLGIETLVPLDERTYAYDYSEAILECDAGAVPTAKTPRTGIVTVEPE